MSSLERALERGKTGFYEGRRSHERPKSEEGGWHLCLLCPKICDVLNEGGV